MNTLSKEFAIAKCAKYSITHINRMATLWATIESVVKEGIEGDFVETGVFRGGSSMLAAYAFNFFKDERKIWMFDTFKGMVKPGKKDYKFHHKATAKDYLTKWKENKKTDGVVDWCYASYNEVLSNMSKTGYLNYEAVPGDVKKTLSKAKIDKISILRIDIDFYEPTKIVLKKLYDKVSPGGYILFDDYYVWSGTADAVHEFFKKRNLSVKQIINKDIAIYRKQ